MATKNTEIKINVKAANAGLNSFKNSIGKLDDKLLTTNNKFKEINLSAKSLNTVFKNANKNFSDTAKATRSLGSAVSKVSEKAGKAGDKFKNLSSGLKTSITSIKNFDKKINQMNSVLDGSKNKIKELVAENKKLKKALENNGIKKSTTRQKTFQKSLVQTVARTAVLIYAIQKLYRGIKFIFETLYDSVENYNLTIAKIASLKVGDKSSRNIGNLAERYKDARDYAKDLFKVMEQMSFRTLASAKEIGVMTEELAKQNIWIDKNNAAQKKGYENIINAVTVISAGSQSKLVQMRQEIRALLQGQDDKNSQLGSLLNIKLNGKLKESIALWRNEGTVIQHLGDLLEGFGASSDDLLNTWTVIGSTLDTLTQRIFRASFEDYYKGINSQLIDMNNYLLEQKDYLVVIVERWLSISGAVKTVGEGIASFKDIGTFFTQGNGAGIDDFLYIFTVGIPSAFKFIFKEVKDIVLFILNFIKLLENELGGLVAIVIEGVPSAIKSIYDIVVSVSSGVFQKIYQLFIQYLILPATKKIQDLLNILPDKLKNFIGINFASSNIDEYIKKFETLSNKKISFIDTKELKDNFILFNKISDEYGEIISKDTKDLSKNTSDIFSKNFKDYYKDLTDGMAKQFDRIEKEEAKLYSVSLKNKNFDKQKNLVGPLPESEYSKKQTLLELQNKLSALKTENIKKISALEVYFKEEKNRYDILLAQKKISTQKYNKAISLNEIKKFAETQRLYKQELDLIIKKNEVENSITSTGSEAIKVRKKQTSELASINKKLVDLKIKSVDVEKKITLELAKQNQLSKQYQAEKDIRDKTLFLNNLQKKNDLDRKNFNISEYDYLVKKKQITQDILQTEIEKLKLQKLYETDDNKKLLLQEQINNKERAKKDTKSIDSDIANQTVEGAYSKLAKKLTDSKGQLIEFATSTAEAMNNAFETGFFDLMTGNFENIGKLLKGFLNDIQKVLSKQLANQVVGGILGGGSAGGGLLGRLFGKLHNGGYIPKFHSGGIKSDEGLALLQTGEGILSRKGITNLGKLNNGGINSGLDYNALGSVIANAISTQPIQVVNSLNFGKAFQDYANTLTGRKFINEMSK